MGKTKDKEPSKPKPSIYSLKPMGGIAKKGMYFHYSKIGQCWRN
jgi:hypothetical protein